MDGVLHQGSALSPYLFLILHETSVDEGRVEGGRVDDGNKRGRNGARHGRREGGSERERDCARKGWSKGATK